jgi:hypothetical protein
MNEWLNAMNELTFVHITRKHQLRQREFDALSKEKSNLLKHRIPRRCKCTLLLHRPAVHIDMGRTTRNDSQFSRQYRTNTLFRISRRQLGNHNARTPGRT